MNLYERGLCVHGKICDARGGVTTFVAKVAAEFLSFTS